MLITATRNFLLNGQHVPEGATLDVDSDTGAQLVATNRAIISPEATKQGQKAKQK